MIESNPSKQPEETIFTWPVGLTVNKLITDAVYTCWALLPEDKRSAETVGAIIRPLVERALAKAHEDVEFFVELTRPLQPAIQKNRKKQPGKRE